MRAWVARPLGSLAPGSSRAAVASEATREQDAARSLAGGEHQLQGTRGLRGRAHHTGCCAQTCLQL